VLSRVRAGRKQPQLSTALILPGHANLAVCFSRFAACRMVRMQPVASAACGVGTASACCRPLPPQCLRRWLCIAGRCSGPPAASADLYAMQQAKKSSAIRSGLRVRGDHAAQRAEAFSCSVRAQAAPAFSRCDLAWSWHAGRSLSSFRRLPHGTDAACRLSRLQRGYSFGMLSATFTAVPPKVALHSRSLQRTACGVR